MKAVTLILMLAFSSTGCGVNEKQVPAGYITSSGLIWGPIGTWASWPSARDTCIAMNTGNMLGYSTGWRQPTHIELLALYVARASVTPSWPPWGWTLGNTWSSTDFGAGGHYRVGLKHGQAFGDLTFDDGYVSCVHSV